jgi:GT2 family glycosyltransferase
MTDVDAVIVSYNSAGTLRACVEPLTALPGVRVTVVDNDSPDDSLATIADLPADTLASGRNGGFGFGSNLGAARGSAPLILFLNPDARLEPGALDALRRTLAEHPDVALAGPAIRDEQGELQYTQRNFPRLRSTWSQALFLHRVAPTAAWTDEVIRDPEQYGRANAPQWLSGACMLVRRSAFEAIGGFDERFFLYCEDIDLCRRLRAAGHELRYVPDAAVRHVGGASAPRVTTNRIYAQSRVRYARKHYRRPAVAAERLGIAVGEATHAVASLRRPAKARGHLAALAAVIRPVRQGV